MKTLTLILAAALTSITALSAGLVRQSSPPASVRPSAPPAPQKLPSAGAQTFTIDSVHSSVIFRIQHAGVSNFYGRFNQPTGTYTLDPANPEKSSFDLQIQTANVDTGNQKRDNHLKNPDFFNAAEFPTIHFKSTKVAKAGDNKLRVTGDLDLHGVTKPVTADVVIFPGKEVPRQGFKSGFETTFIIKRSDFEMDTYIAEGALGDEVQITFAAEGATQ